MRFVYVKDLASMDYNGVAVSCHQTVRTAFRKVGTNGVTMNESQASGAGAAWTPGSYSLPTVHTGACCGDAFCCTTQRHARHWRDGNGCGQGLSRGRAWVGASRCGCGTRLPPANAPVQRRPPQRRDSCRRPCARARIVLQGARVGVAQPPPAPPPVESTPAGKCAANGAIVPAACGLQRHHSRQQVGGCENHEGWRKEFPLRRALAYVGSQPGSDIYLVEPDVARATFSCAMANQPCRLSGHQLQQCAAGSAAGKRANAQRSATRTRLK